MPPIPKCPEPPIQAGRKTETGRRANGAFVQELVAGNVIAALRDESDTLIARWVDELLKEPEVRKKIEYHSREIVKAIASGL